MRDMTRAWKIDRRIWLIVLIAIVGLAATATAELVRSRDRMLEDRRMALRQVVEVAYGIADYFYQQTQSGALDTAAAQKAAADAIKVLRYGAGEYFFVQQGSVMVMHPLAPQLIGKDLIDLKDKRGQRFVADMVRVVRESGAGFVDYMWPRQGGDQPVPKLSYIEGFAPWGWLIGSGVYVDDLHAAAVANLVGELSIVIPVALVLIVISGLLARSIQRRLRNTQQAMANIAAGEGDLTQRLDESGGDEISAVAREFNRFCSRIQELIRQMTDTTAQLYSSVENMTRVVQGTHEGITRQQHETDQVATAVHEMSATVQEVARNAASAAESARQANLQAQNGQQVVTGNRDAIGTLANGVSEAAEVINQLQAESEGVGTILDVIRGIADQTNLLALNAAIEAARAGEQGRGFAVVADEVRTLAQRTQESTAEIQELISSLQQKAANAVSAMEQGRTQAEQSVERASQVNQSLSEITQAIGQINDLNTQIASAAEEQAAVTEEINRNLANITTIAETSASGASQTQSAAEAVYQQIAGLQGLVRQFKIH